MMKNILILSLILVARIAMSQITLQSQVLAVYPPQNATSVPVGDSLVVQFAPELNIHTQTLSDTTFVVQAQHSGWHRGTVTYDQQNHTVTLKPTKPFFVGELITAVVTKKIQFDSAGETKNIRGFAWQFYGKVTRKTQATFRDTLQIITGGNTFLDGFRDIDGDGNLDINYEHAPGDVVAFNSGDGVTYQNVVLNMPGNIYAADYRLVGYMDIVLGYSSCTLDHNKGDRSFSVGSEFAFNNPSKWNAQVDLDFDGVPE